MIYFLTYVILQADPGPTDIFDSCCYLIDAIESKMTTTGKAPACEVEIWLRNVEPKLFETKSRIRSLGHYLMHMRSKGAPIRFESNRSGITWISFA